MTMVLRFRVSEIRFLAVQFCAMVTALILGFIAAEAVAAKTHDIAVSTDRGIQQRVEARFEHEGKLTVVAGTDQGEAKQLPMDTVATMTYYQRLTGSKKDPQAIRYFESAKGNFNIEKGKVNSSVTSKNSIIVARLKSVPGQRLQMASVKDTLSQSEFELIKNPADPLTYAKLLNKKGVAVGTKWDTENDALADFLAIDRILHNETQLLLKDVVKDTARIYMLGRVDATIDDVATGLKVSCIFDVNLKSKMVTDVRLNITEMREAGQVAAGFEGKSKVDIRLTKDSSCDQLSNASLKKYAQSRRVSQKLRWSSEAGRFALEYDPRWRLIAAEQEVAVMRYIDDGDLMAQCNIVQLPSRPANNPLTLSDYKTEVEKMIRSEKTATIAEADQLTTANGLKALKVIVKGEEGGVPVEWIYYHVASEDGRRLTFVFTLEQEIAKVFQPSDHRMVNGLSFFVVPQKTAKVSSNRGQRKTAGRPNPASASKRR